MSNNFGNSFFLTQNIFSKTREQFVSSENYFQTRILILMTLRSYIIFSLNCLRVQMHTPFNKEFSLLKTNTHSFHFEI